MNLDIGGALQAGANTASGLLEASIKEDSDIRAANRKLSDAERLLAIQESFKNRAAERFGTSVKNKMGTQVPVGADQPTGETGFGGEAGGSYGGTATTAAEQGLLNAKQGEPRTRSMTREEAIKSAQEDNLLNDPAAYKAGKDLVTDKYMTLADGASLFDTTTGKLVLANSSKEDRLRLIEEGKDRRHAETIDMQEKRLNAQLEKVANGTDKVLQHQFLNSMENDIRDAESRIKATEKTKKDLFDPKDIQDANDAIKELTEQKAMLKRSKIEFARNSGIQIPDAYKEPSTAPSKPLASLPPGAKQVGTSGGKPVFEVNGKRFIQN